MFAESASGHHCQGGLLVRAIAPAPGGGHAPAPCSALPLARRFLLSMRPAIRVISRCLRAFCLPYVCGLYAVAGNVREPQRCRAGSYTPGSMDRWWEIPGSFGGLPMKVSGQPRCSSDARSSRTITRRYRLASATAKGSPKGPRDH